MPDDPTPFEPLEVPDLDARLSVATRQVRRRRQRKALVAAATTAGVAAVAVVLPLALTGGSTHGSTQRLTATQPPVTSAPPTLPTYATDSSASPSATAHPRTTARPTVDGPVGTFAPSSADPTSAAAGPAPRTPTAPPSGTRSSAPSGPPVTGVVTDTAGDPVAGGYVIGLTDATTVRTAADGSFSLPCSGAGQAVLAAQWDVPIYEEADDSTTPGDAVPAGAAPGLGYRFGPGSDGATDHASAPTIACGSRVSYVLPVGGALSVTFVPPSGQRVPTDLSASILVPGMDGTYDGSDFGDLPARASTTVPGISAGTLKLAITYPVPATCTGPGVVDDGDYIWSVPITAGQTEHVTCQIAT